MTEDIKDPELAAPDPEAVARIRRWQADPVAFISDAFYFQPDPTEPPTSFGSLMEPFQRDFLNACFAAKPDKTPVFRVVYNETRRSEGKTLFCAAAAVADLYLGPAGHISYCCAGDLDQAALIVDAITQIKRHSSILANLIVQRNRVISPTSGSELRIIAADVPTAFGLNARKVWMDEMSEMPTEDLWNVMWSTVGKSAYSQMICTSMAGFDFAGLAWKVRSWAKERDNWYFSTRQGSSLPPWLSQATMDEQEATLHPSYFKRFWLCEWSDPAGAWISAEMWETAERGTEIRFGDKTRKHFIFVDLGIVKDATAIAVCHADENNNVVLDTLRTMRGTHAKPVILEEVDDLVVHLTENFPTRKVMYEAWQGTASVQSLQKRLPGISVELSHPNQNSQRDLFGNLWGLLRDSKLIVFPHEELKREALGLVIKTAGTAWKVADGKWHQDHVIATGGAAQMVIQDMIGKRGLAEVGNLGGVNASFVRHGGKPAPFNFGGSGREPISWSGGVGAAGADYDPRTGHTEAENDEAIERAIHRDPYA